MIMRGVVLAALMLALAASTAAAESGLLVCDIDAHQLDVNHAGAVFGIDRTAAPDAPPRVIAAADQTAGFEAPSEVVVSPADGTLYVIDFRVSLPPTVLSTCGGTTQSVIRNPQFVNPWNAQVLGDGTILIADSDADPSGFGTDSLGGPGHGCLWRLDPAARIATVVSNGSAHDPMPGSAGATCFEDPAGVAVDEAAGIAYVIDFGADPLGAGNWAAVYAVRLSDGYVTLVSSTPGFWRPISCARRADGSLVVLDPGGGPGDTYVYRVETSPADPAVNATVLSLGTQYAEGTDITVDAADQVIVMDWGEYDFASSSFIVEPAVFLIDETDPDPAANARLVHRSTALLSPLSIAIGPGCTILPETMAINRRTTAPVTVAAMRMQFDASCQVAPWAVCPEVQVDGPLDGMLLAGEAQSVPGGGLSLYQHADVVTTMKVTKSGADLVFSAN